MRSLLKSKLFIGVTIVLLLVVMIIALGRSNEKAAPPAATPPEVVVAPVVQKDVPIYSEWIGTLDGLVNADIRAQVSGYLLTRKYTEGSFVRKGELLFEIDPRPFQAALDQAKGNLAQANGQLAQANAQLVQAQAQLAQSEANQVKAQLDVDRYTPLARQNAITNQELDNAVQANLAAKAEVKAATARVETSKAAIVAAKAAGEAAGAAVHTAELNLGFTTITSPINGIAGIAAAQVGNLVNPSSGLLTTVSTVDPIKVYFTLSEKEYLDNSKRGTLDANKKLDELELVLVDGSIYPHKGRFFVADREISKETGSIRLAGLFANPNNTLRPGQYGRVRAITSLKKGALLVPQRAVSELQGNYRIAVVGNDNKVNIRTVKVGDRVDSMWIIEDGLKAGERVVAEGTQKVRPEMMVSPKPLAAPAIAATK